MKPTLGFSPTLAETFKVFMPRATKSCRAFMLHLELFDRRISSFVEEAGCGCRCHLGEGMPLARWKCFMHSG